MAKNTHGQAAIERRSASARRLRAQAAMEYLMTYGWALLALFAVVAFLLASGAFSPDSFSVQECTFQPDLSCSSFILYKVKDREATRLSFILSNGLGFPIKIRSVEFLATDLGESGRQEYKMQESQIPDDIFQSGSKIGFSYDFEGTKQPKPKQFKTVLATITYFNCKHVAEDEQCGDEGDDAAPYYTTSGRISAVVEEEA